MLTLRLHWELICCPSQNELDNCNCSLSWFTLVKTLSWWPDSQVPFQWGPTHWKSSQPQSCLLRNFQKNQLLRRSPPPPHNHQLILLCILLKSSQDVLPMNLLRPLLTCPLDLLWTSLNIQDPPQLSHQVQAWWIVVNSPSRCPLYLSLALCVDHLSILPTGIYGNINVLGGLVGSFKVVTKTLVPFRANHSKLVKHTVTIHFKKRENSFLLSPQDLKVKLFVNQRGLQQNNL